MNFRTRNIVFAFFLMLFFFSGCNNNGQSGHSILPVSFMSTENRVSNSYAKYIKKVSTSEFTLEQSLRKNEKVVEGFHDEIASNPDLLFFTATLWQMCALKEKENWEQPASNYFKQVENIILQDGLFNGELLQSIYLLPYQINPNKELLDKIIESLSKHISDYELKTIKNGAKAENNLDLLLENEIMFMVTKETGDRVFRNFALENTSFLFDEYFRRNLRIMSVLTNDVSEKNLANLHTEDFYKLAVGICGFYQFYKETGIDDYLTCCKAIATVFKTVLFDPTIDIEIVNRVDLISQSLVSLALLDLGQQKDDSYQDASARIYENILKKIKTEHSSENHVNRAERDSHESFRLYYYLLKYELRKQDLIKI